MTVFLSFQGILAIFVGIALGIAWGVLCDYIPDHSDYYAPTIRSILIFGGGFLLTYAGGYVGWGGVCEYNLNHTIICVQRCKKKLKIKKIYTRNQPSRGALIPFTTLALNYFNISSR